MCLVTLQKTTRTTKKDLVVYKMVDRDSSSYGIVRSHYYPEFIWEEEEPHKTKLSVTHCAFNAAQIYDGSVLTHFEKMKRFNNGKIRVTEVREGYHACLTRVRAEDGWSSRPIRQFLIPKGSKVFTDGTGLIVSNQMMLMK